MPACRSGRVRMVTIACSCRPRCRDPPPLQQSPYSAASRPRSCTSCTANHPAAPVEAAVAVEQRAHRYPWSSSCLRRSTFAGSHARTSLLATRCSRWDRHGVVHDALAFTATLSPTHAQPRAGRHVVWRHDRRACCPRAPAVRSGQQYGLRGTRHQALRGLAERLHRAA